MSKIFVQQGNAAVSVSDEMERLVKQLLDANPIIKRAIEDDRAAPKSRQDGDEFAWLNAENKAAEGKRTVARIPSPTSRLDLRIHSGRQV